MPEDELHRVADHVEGGSQCRVQLAAGRALNVAVFHDRHRRICHALDVIVLLYVKQVGLTRSGWGCHDWRWCDSRPRLSGDVNTLDDVADNDLSHDVQTGNGFAEHGVLLVEVSLSPDGYVELAAT